MNKQVSDNDYYPAWRLFHNTYRVRVPEIFFHDPNWVATFGRPTSGDKKTDRALLNSTRTVWWTVDNIAEIFSIGGEISFVNHQEDPFIVYTDIQEHLKEWSRIIRYLDQSLNKYRGIMPVEDLIKFSNLADAIYPLIEGFDKNIVSSGKLPRGRSFNRKNRFLKKPETVEEETKESYELDGSHIFVPDLMGTNPEAPVLTEKERVEVIKENLKDRHHESFTDFFENFLFNSMAEKQED